MSGLQAILAISEDGAIGQGNKIPWAIGEDLTHFKAVTTGHAVIMGRKTYESLGRPLPGRKNIVVTSSGALPNEPQPEYVVRTPEDALKVALGLDPEPFVIGGAQIYGRLWQYVQRLYLTRVHATYPEADVRFGFDRDDWVEKWVDHGKGHDIVRLERIPPLTPLERVSRNFALMEAESEIGRLRLQLMMSHSEARYDDLRARWSQHIARSLPRVVRAFHEKFGHPIAWVPHVPDEKQVRFRLKLIAEEFLELIDATFDLEPKPVTTAILYKWDAHRRELHERLQFLIEQAPVDVKLPDFADAQTDLDWVNEGTRAVMGITAASILMEVERANMSKDPVYVAAKDEHHRTPDPAAKPTKPEGWTPPAIAEVLRKQGWRG